MNFNLNADAKKIKLYFIKEDGNALTEAALLIPVLITLLMGTFDLGRGIILNQKTITASQVAADLVARNKFVDSVLISDIVDAARLAYQPYNSTEFGIDIVSIEFDADGNPIILWRETQNMSPNDAAVASTLGLGTEGDGMIIVTTTFDYNPVFANSFVGEINMQETAFSRGRRSPTVQLSGA